MRFGSLIMGGGSLFGDGSYSGNIVQNGSILQPQPYMLNGESIPNCIVITGAATIAPDAATFTAFASADSIILSGSSASISASIPCKGLFVAARTRIEWVNGAGASASAKGYPGKVALNPTLYSLIPSARRAAFKKSFWSAIELQKDGAYGAAGVTAWSDGGANGHGLTGKAGASWQTGGGGSGGKYYSGNSGAGGIGSAFSGGSGSAGIAGMAVGTTTPDAAPYGGAGSSCFQDNGSGGGAGNPGGNGTWDTTNLVYTGIGSTGTGGLAIFAAPRLVIRSGSTIQSNGSLGGDGSTYAGGGSSGGGILGFIYRDTFINQGTIQANGGGNATVTGGTGCYGGAGGVGSINIVQAA